MPDAHITKLTHACVRIELGGVTLVIDPGIWSEPDELDGADAVLVTHEHLDHVDPVRIAATGIPVYAPEGAAIDGLDVTRVGVGSSFTVGGIAVRAVGERHGVTFDGQPSCANFGYLVDDRIYHPGDALALPRTPVETLLVPMAGPWLGLRDAIGFVRAVGPRRALGIHDAMLSERGIRTINHWLAEMGGTDFRYLRAEETA